MSVTCDLVFASHHADRRFSCGYFQVTVAKAIELEDKLKNCGVKLAKEVASKTNDMAGDGTTTATVLGRAIFKEGCKAVAAGMNPMDLKRGIDQAVKLVLEDLKKQAKPITTSDEIKQVSFFLPGRAPR